VTLAEVEPVFPKWMKRFKWVCEYGKEDVPE
jgi:hypothetical protein